VLEIHAKKNLRMKGQAFVIFKDLPAASEAMRSLQGTNFFGKLLDIHYSKARSDIVAKNEGTFDPNERKKRRQRREEEMQKIHEERKKKTEPTEGTENPNSILFVEGLIPDITTPMLNTLFEKYPGLKEVRIIPGKLIAFIEYMDETQAGVALIGMNGFKISNDCVLKVSFAKK
jgi:U2 small nuclear ribonucleoprotein B''